MNTAVVGLVIFVLGGAAPGADPAPAKIPPIYPVITEVLFNVPQGSGGDANKDGARSASGDEFVEIFNPTAGAIQLRGYRIVNRLAYSEPDVVKGVRFIFPEMLLPPGGVAVVFNGHDAKIEGPVGDSHKAPKGPNANFHGAMVFRMEFKGRATGFNNGGDFVALVSPDGKAIDVVAWGDSDPAPPSTALRVETVKAGVKGSVQRINAQAPMQEHRVINDELFSPGAIPAPGVATAPAAAPGDAPADGAPAATPAGDSPAPTPASTKPAPKAKPKTTPKQQ